MGNDKISKKEMRETICRSGYLLEQRVESVIRQSFGYVETNSIYKDSDTGKTCELDLSAISASSRLYRKDLSFIFPYLLCECENNSQPLVLFTRESVIPYLRRLDLKVSGLPVKFWMNHAKAYQPFADFANIENFHHYCNGEIATQYCSFQYKKDKSGWLALHNEEQHDTFNKLIKAVDYQVNKHFDSWWLPDKAEEEAVNVQLYYPLVILQGGLYSASLKKEQLTLKKSNHIQYRKTVFSSHSGEEESYQIDIIVESYLPGYLKILEAEIETISESFKKKRNLVRSSIKRITDEIKKDGGSPKSFRKFFDFIDN